MDDTAIKQLTKKDYGKLVATLDETVLKVSTLNTSQGLQREKMSEHWQFHDIITSKSIGLLN